ncbi:MAG: RNA-binding domain-containing protein, partial [Actinomycetota bacterium]
VERIRVDAEFASLVAQQLGVTGAAAFRTVAEIVDNDEDFAVEFKSTARWDLRENQPSKAMEDAIVKTVAAFLNTDGGTLLIGVGPDRQVVGLEHDYARVKPPNGDGFVNWLTTHLINALGRATVMRTRARIAVHEGREICRVDVARSAQPVWAKTSKQERVFFIRMNNSSRAMPEEEVEAYLRSRAAPPKPPHRVQPFELVTPAEEDRYVTCVPLLSLKAAAGGFGEAQEVEPEGWVRFDSRTKFRPGMFVAQVAGRSMEPRIPDESFCLFSGPVAGSRQGKILLVQHREIWDPDNSGTYTVKRYSSTKEQGGDSWRHTEIRLEPMNPDFEPIILEDVPDKEFQVLAEVIEVLD